LLQRDLDVRVHVLHGTATADLRVLTGGLDTIGRGDEHFLGLQFIELATAAGEHGTDRFAGQRSFHERNLAVDVGNAAAIVAKALNLYCHCLGRQSVTLSSGSFHGQGSGVSMARMTSLKTQENTPVDR